MIRRSPVFFFYSTTLPKKPCNFLRTSLPSIYLFIYLSICLSVYQSIYPSLSLSLSKEGEREKERSRQVELDVVNQNWGIERCGQAAQQPSGAARQEISLPLKTMPTINSPLSLFLYLSIYLYLFIYKYTIYIYSSVLYICLTNLICFLILFTFC